MKNKYQEALQNLYDMRGKLIDVSSKNTQWANNIKIYDFIGDQLRTLQELVDKMKPIEQDLGCPLEVVFKALMNGSCGSIYTFIQNDYNGIYKIGLYKAIIINGLTRECNGKDFYFSCYDSLTYKGYKFYLKDYKKTWWLSETKEE